MCGDVNANQPSTPSDHKRTCAQDALKRGKTVQNLALPTVSLPLTAMKGLVLAIV
jgi:hypothetical protein